MRRYATTTIWLVKMMPQMANAHGAGVSGVGLVSLTCAQQLAESRPRVTLVAHVLWQSR